MKTYIIGDIHGCYDELIALTKQINLKPEDLLISVGDLVDRGGKSKEVYEYFKNRPNSIVLMGNHERKHLNGVLSYGQEIVKVQFGADYEAFLAWVAELPYYHEIEEAIIVHAAFEHDVPLAEQREEVLCGATAGERYLEKKYGTERYWTEFYQGNKPIIYGHHVVGYSPKIVNNTYGIDTAACHGDYLTAIELPGFKIHQVKSPKDYWLEEQRIWQLPVLKAKDWVSMSFVDIQKQIDKLDYVETPEVKDYLSALSAWMLDLRALMPQLKVGIEQLAEKLLSEHGEEGFNEAAAQYICKTYIFQSRKGKLREEGLQETLNSPQKIIDLATLLNVPVRRL